MIRYALALLTLSVGACSSDETLTRYGGAGDWRLRELDGEAFLANATLSLTEPDRVSGAAPCNRFFGPQSAPYPWFDAGPLASTKRACPDLAEEARFLGALEAMTIAEVSGDILILSNEAGGQMVFTRIAPDG